MKLIYIKYCFNRAKFFDIRLLKINHSLPGGNSGLSSKFWVVKTLKLCEIYKRMCDDYGESWMCLRAVVTESLDSDSIVSEFEIQSSYYSHFRTTTLSKDMKSLILLSFSLDTTITVILHEWLGFSKMKNKVLLLMVSKLPPEIHSDLLRWFLFFSLEDIRNRPTYHP